MSGNNCVFNNLTSNTTYYYKKCITSNAGNSSCSSTSSLLTAGGVYAYDYTGSEQTLTIPVNGTYKLETWGAQGGSIDSNIVGGYGGYSYGQISINKNNTNQIYINVGGKGDFMEDENSSDNKVFKGGYNGGANGNYGGGGSGAGGGATHIASTSGLLSSLSKSLSSVYIVSAGGGGANKNWYWGTFSGGAGGGYVGNKGYNITTKTYCDNYGSQVGTVGYSGTAYDRPGFGQGGGLYDFATGGGGGGYYGGGAITWCSGGGGASYIGNSALTDKGMYCYNCTASTATDTKTTSTTCTSSTPTANCAKQGNGYAKITILATSN